MGHRDVVGAQEVANVYPGGRNAFLGTVSSFPDWVTNNHQKKEMTFDFDSTNKVKKVNLHHLILSGNPGLSVRTGDATAKAGL